MEVSQAEWNIDQIMQIVERDWCSRVGIYSGSSTCACNKCRTTYCHSKMTCDGKPKCCYCTKSFQLCETFALKESNSGGLQIEAILQNVSHF